MIINIAVPKALIILVLLFCSSVRASFAVELSQNQTFSSDDATVQQQLKEAQLLLKQGKVSQSLALYKSLANTGNEYAHFSLGTMFENGIGTEKSMQEACFHYQQSSTKLVPMGLFKTAQCIQQHHLTVTNKEERVLNLYQQALQSGIIPAACEIAKINLKTSSDQAKRVESVGLCQQAAQTGSIDAAFTLGQWALEGKYVEKNEIAAIKYFEMAKPHYYAPAAYRLGTIYDKQNTPESITKAVHHYQMAASQGYEPAYLPLALLYFNQYQQVEDDQGTLLAKAYLWAKAANIVSLNSPQKKAKHDSTILLDALANLVPTAWSPKLTKQALEHVKAHHDIDHLSQ